MTKVCTWREREEATDALRICGRFLPEFGTPVRVAVPGVGLLDFALCSAHTMHLPQVFADLYGAVLDDSEEAKISAGRIAADLADQTIRKGLRVLKKLGKIPKNTRIPERGPVGEAIVALFLANRGELLNIPPEDWDTLAQAGQTRRSSS